MMVAAWALAALCPGGPYPILTLQGEQGSGKSILTKLLRGVVDPNVAPIRAAPRDENDLIVAAKNGHALALDNISRIDAATADALCRVATGGGFSARAKYTDDVEFVVWTCNPIVLNGIPALADRPDFASRALIVHLQAIPDDARRNEREFWSDWNSVAPRVLGALCDALSTALRRLPDVRPAKASRMADFERLILAAAPALGWEPSEFFAAYDANRRDLEAEVVDSDAVAQAIIGMVGESSSDFLWEGTATWLLELLTAKVSDVVKRSRAWPQASNALGNRIKRLTPLLRKRGIILSPGHSGSRFITIRRAATPSAGQPPH